MLDWIIQEKLIDAKNERSEPKSILIPGFFFRNGANRPVSDADRMSYAYLQKLTLKSASPLPFNATGNRTGTSRSLTHAPAEGLSARSPLKSRTRRETRSGTRSVRLTPNGNPQNPTPVADCPPPRCSTPSLPAAVTSQPHQPFWRVQKDHSQPKQVSGPNAKAPKHQAIIMSVGPKRTRQTGTEHLNKQEVTQAWRTAKIDAERAGMFLLGSSTSSCGELGLMAAVSANLHEPPQHLNTTVGTSRAGVPKQLPKHPEKQIKTLQPGFHHQGLEKKGEPKHAQGTEHILKEFP